MNGGAAVLLKDMPDLVRDGGGFDEEAVGGVRVTFARPGDVDDGVDHDIGDVDALGASVARDRLGEDALRRLGGREAGELGASALGGGVAGRDDRARALSTIPAPTVARGKAGPSCWSGSSVGVPRIDAVEGAEGAAHGVVHQDRRRAHVASQGGKRGVDLRFIRDVAGVSPGMLDIPLQRRQALAIAGEHGDGVTAGGKPAHNRAARTWTDACDDSNGTIHVCIPSNGLFPILHSKKTLIKS